MPSPFQGKRFLFTQPDGSPLEVKGWGSQFKAQFETLDGQPLYYDESDGYYKLGSEAPSSFKEDQATNFINAKFQEGGSSRWQKRLNEERDKTNTILELPTLITGSYKGLCLLICFPDVPPTISAKEVNDFCNQLEYRGFGNNGSVMDYFNDNSNKQLTYTNVVTAYYTTRHPRSYYTDRTVPYVNRAREIIHEALDHLEENNFDFQQLSVDQTGHVYALNVFYSGQNINNFSEGLWPHAFWLTQPRAVSSGIMINDYQITDMGDELSLGTFCHENGHMLCSFPDLYDVGQQSFGIGYYCLMSYGGTLDIKNPVNICAYLRQRAGWIQQVTSLNKDQIIHLDFTGKQIAIYERNKHEYFILEARSQRLRDRMLPDQGLAIWHIDTYGSNEWEQMTESSHYQCSLEQADSNLDLEQKVNCGGRGDLYDGSKIFSSATQPSSNWWDGSTSGLKITSVIQNTESISFQVKINPAIET